MHFFFTTDSLCLFATVILQRKRNFDSYEDNDF